MHKSQFQNSRLDLGLRSQREVVAASGRQMGSTGGSLSSTSPFGNWSCLLAPTTRVLETKARLHGFELITVNEFGDYGFELLEEL